MTRALTGVALAILLVMTACQSPVEVPPASGRVRVSLASADTVAPQLKVWVEGAGGQLLTGARVTVTKPDASVDVVGYSPTQGCFLNVVDGAPDGTYLVEVDSLAWKASQTVALEHQVLRTRPELVSLNDGIGEVFSGNALDASRSWTMGWTPVAGASSYFVQVTQGSTVVWSQTTAFASTAISAGSLPVGTLQASVVAQFSAGDPLFRSAPYLSVSHAASAVVTFHSQ